MINQFMQVERSSDQMMVNEFWNELSDTSRVLLHVFQSLCPGI